jgi:hypothetical protein
MIAKTSKEIKRVAFFGDAEAAENSEHYKMAYDTAKLFAENGYIVVNGGGPGVMLASTLGAKAGGGKVEVVIIDEKVDMGANYEGSGNDNKSLADVIFRTDNIERRTGKLLEVSDAFLIFKGGTGTMAELALVWEKAKFDYGNHEPLVFMGDFWKDLIDTMTEDLDFDKYEKSVYEIVNSPREALEVIKSITE